VNAQGVELKMQGRLIRVGRPDADGYESLEQPATILNEIRNLRLPIDLFTFMQIMPDKKPSFSYAMEWDNLAVLPVSTFDHWWTHQIRSFPRNRARQAEKRGVTIREAFFDEALVQGIREVYNECPVRQGKRFIHYGKNVDTLRKEMGTYLDSSIFIGAFLDKKLIGFAKLTCDKTRTQANVMSIVAMIQHRDKAPTNALIAQAVRSCADRRIPYLVYQSFSYGRKRNDTLREFKENNGFQRVDVPRYYIPLTRRGWIAFRFGLHRGLTEYVPESFLSKLRQVRNTWHSRKLQVTSEAS
jgi:hypothetical protein